MQSSGYRLPICLFLEARMSAPQYRVIDASDECSKYQEPLVLFKNIHFNSRSESLSQVGNP